MVLEVLCLLLAIVCALFLLKILWSLEHSLRGEYVFITGCDTGFGHLLSKRLAGKGLIVFAGCLNPDGEGATSLTTQFPDNVIIISCDVTDDVSVEKAVDLMRSRVGEKGLWAVVNNAGIGVAGDFELTPLADFRHVLDVNLLGVFRCTMACLPLLRRSRGRVIHMGSTASVIVSPALGVYGISKAALLVFNNVLRTELKKFGVLSIIIRPFFYRTNIVNPGPIRAKNAAYLAQLSPETRAVYNDAYVESYMKMFGRGLQESGTRLDDVIDVLDHAISARFPRRDYPIPFKAYLMEMAWHFSPSWFQDWLIKEHIPCYKMDLMRKGGDVRSSDYLM